MSNNYFALPPPKDAWILVVLPSGLLLVLPSQSDFGWGEGRVWIQSLQVSQRKLLGEKNNNNSTSSAMAMSMATWDF